MTSLEPCYKCKKKDYSCPACSHDSDQNEKETEHFPAPWHYNQPDGDDYTYLIDSEGHQIAKMLPTDPEIIDDMTEEEESIRQDMEASTDALIQFAPELLKALKLAVGFMPSSKTQRRITNIIRQAEAQTPFATM